MKFKIYFNDNNSVEILDEKLQKISVNELLQKLIDSDYNEEHEIEFYTKNNDKISFIAGNSYEVLNGTLYQIRAKAFCYDDLLDFKYIGCLDIFFKISEVYCYISNLYSPMLLYPSYSLFNEKMNDIINKWWKSTVNISVNDEFRNIFNAILKIEIQRAIEYRTNNFTKIKENLLVYKKILLDQKKEIDDKIDSCSSVLLLLDDESKKLNLRK